MNTIKHNAVDVSKPKEAYKPQIDTETTHRNTMDRSGKFRGQHVTWKPSATSMLEDGAEEIGLFVGERLADKLSKKEKNNKSGTRLQDLIKKTGEFYRAKVPDLKSNDGLHDFYFDLINERQPSKEFIMKMATRFFADRTLQYAGLNFVRDVLGRQDGHHLLKAAVDGAVKELKKDHGSEINAGMNISANADLFSRKYQLGTVRDLRACYQDIVFIPDTIGKVYETIIRRLKKEDINFKVMFEYLRSSAVVELSITGAASSVSKTRLHQCINDFERLKLISGLYGGAGDILRGLKKNYGLGKKVSHQSFFGFILEVFSRTLYASNVLNKLTTILQIKDVPPFLYLLHNMLKLLRSAHPKSFAKRSDRDTLLRFFQNQIDEAVQHETE